MWFSLKISEASVKCKRIPVCKLINQSYLKALMLVEVKYEHLSPAYKYKTGCTNNL